MDKVKDKCVKIEDKFVYCQETIDGINCDVCINNYYFSEDGQCTDTILCSKTDKGKCIECISGAKLLKDNSYQDTISIIKIKNVNQIEKIMNLNIV